MRLGLLVKATHSQRKLLTIDAKPRQESRRKEHSDLWDQEASNHSKTHKGAASKRAGESCVHTGKVAVNPATIEQRIHNKYQYEWVISSKLLCILKRIKRVFFSKTIRITFAH